MIKTKVKILSVDVDTAKNENGEVYSMLFVNFTKGDKPYRINSFLSFAEKTFLSNQLNIDFEKLQLQDISKFVNLIGDLIKDKSRYGEKKYFNVHFECGYDKKIPIEDDAYFLINTMFKADTVSTIAPENTKK